MEWYSPTTKIIHVRIEINHGGFSNSIQQEEGQLVEYIFYSLNFLKETLQ